MRKFLQLTLCFMGISAFACSHATAEQEYISTTRDTLIKYEPKVIVSQLPKAVEEQSGMALHKDLIWVINDSDCKPELIAYDMQGKIQNKVKVSNARNIDWESLAEDDKHFYIGDFGNNHGTRKNLRVLKIAKADLQNGASVKAKEIRFAWADQKEYSRKTHHNNYDCEAFFSWGDSLYLFSKDWADLKTRMYVLPKKEGTYKLKPKAEFEIDFLVTAADISSDGKTMSLLGYKNFLSYMAIFSAYEGTEFFKGKSIRLDLSPLGACQTEGLVFGDNNELYISCEKSMTPQALYQIEWESWKTFLER